MLIKCPECGKDVSDKAPNCIHCGFPLESNNSNLCEIYGKVHDLSKLIEIINGEEIYQSSRLMKTIRFLDDTCGLRVDDAKRLFKEIEATGKIPSSFTPVNRPYETSSSRPLRCPKCGSTAITTGARGINGFWGAIGASKTVNRCGKCGHTWEPRR